jgi:hypothetical protein
MSADAGGHLHIARDASIGQIVLLRQSGCGLTRPLSALARRGTEETPRTRPETERRVRMTPARDQAGS